MNGPHAGAVIGNRTSALQRPVLSAATLRKSEVLHLHYGSSFQMRVIRRCDESVVLFLEGELDVTSMVQFERMITEVLSGRPKN